MSENYQDDLIHYRLDFVYFDADIVEPWFPKVKDFITTITNLINE